MSRDYVDDLLYEWAKWVISGRPQLGFSNRAVIYEMVTTGIIAKGSGLKPEPEAQQEERTDKAVEAMKANRPELFAVIEIHYLGQRIGADHWARVPDKKERARLCHISVPTLDARLATGRDWVEAFLDGLKAA